MQFQAPALLIWSSLLVAAVLLYLFRRRPKRIRVSTLPFFKSLARVYQESAWLRILKRVLSFLLTAAVILFSVGALAQLVVAPPSGQLSSVIVLIDGSASMAAKDAQGQTRLAAAKSWVRERLPGLPPGVEVLVMRYDRHPEILLPHSYDRRAVERALEVAKVRPVPGDPAAALELARRLAALRAPATIWHLTDRPEGYRPPATALPVDVEDPQAPPVPKVKEEPKTDLATAPGQEVKVETINLGLKAPLNVGIVAFQMRRLPLEHARLEAFVQIQTQALSSEPGAEAEDINAKLEIRLDETLVAVRELTLKPGASERLLVPVNASEAGKATPTLTLQVKAEGDVLATDDSVHARVPDSRAVRVAWITDEKTSDPFTQLALKALHDSDTVDAFQVAPSKWPLDSKTFDVVIFDNWLPEKWPTDVHAIVLNPPGKSGPVRAVRLENPLPLDKLRAIEEGHPLLYGVASGRVALTQTAVLEAGGALSPIWVGQAGPVMSAGEVKGQRLVAMGFSPMASEHLGYMASYPLLLGNAILWLVQPEQDARSGNNLRTGHVVEREGVEPIEWSLPGAGPEKTERVARVGSLTELDRIGLWSIGTLQGSASLLSRPETNLVPNGAADEVQTKADSSGLAALFRGDLRPLLLWLVLGALVIEAWLFHRFAVF